MSRIVVNEGKIDIDGNLNERRTDWSECDGFRLASAEEVASMLQEERQEMLNLLERINLLERFRL